MNFFSLHRFPAPIRRSWQINKSVRQRVRETANWRHRFLLALVLSITSSAVMANCRVIHLLDQMHSVQTQLLQNPNTPAFASHVRMIRAHANTINNGMLLDAVDANALSAKGAVFLRFTRNGRELVEQVSIDEPDTIRRHFADPNVRTNLNAIAGYLSGLRCSKSEVAAATLPETDAEDFGRAIQEAAIEYISLFNLLMAAIGAFVLFGLPKVIRFARNGLRLDDMFGSDDRGVPFKMDGRERNGILKNINGKEADLYYNFKSMADVGSKLDFKILGRWISATVIWSEQSHCIVQFDQPLTQQTAKQLARQMETTG